MHVTVSEIDPPLRSATSGTEDGPERFSVTFDDLSKTELFLLFNQFNMTGHAMFNEGFLIQGNIETEFKDDSAISSAWDSLVSLAYRQIREQLKPLNLFPNL